jgi:hypothetical protein
MKIKSGSLDPDLFLVNTGPGVQLYMLINIPVNFVDKLKHILELHVTQHENT